MPAASIVEVTLTEAMEHWAGEAERMRDGSAVTVVVAPELLDGLAREQGTSAPLVGGVRVRAAAPGDQVRPGEPSVAEMAEIGGPDRMCVYVGAEPAATGYPIGYDPSMPVFFVPVRPGDAADAAALDLYNRLRWFGLGPDEARSSLG